MIGTTPVIHALGGGPARLLGPGTMLSLVGFARASAAIYRGADDATFLLAAAGTPRFQGPAQRLLVEGARTNLIRNPRFEGWSGSSSSFPTNMNSVTSNGVVRELLAVGTVDGLPYMDLRWTGTPTSTGVIRISLEPNGQVAAVVGQAWTYSAYFQVLAGGLTNIGVALAITQRDAVPNLLGTLSSGPLAVTGTRQRFVFATTTSSSATATIVPELQLPVTLGAAVNLTLRIFAPQLEQGAFASSPMLPAAGTPGATARTADNPSYPLSAAQQQRGTLVGTFLVPQPAPAGLEQGLLQIDDGTDANRVVLQNAAGGNVVQALLVSGGGTLATLAAGSMVPGTAFRAALGWNAAGVSACLGGGTVQSWGALPAGLTRLLIGHASAGLGRAAFGEIGALDLHSTRLPDATLQALTSN